MADPVLFHDLWAFDDVPASLMRFQAAASEHDGEAALQARTQVARALGLMGRFDEARDVLDDVGRRLPAEPGTVTVRWYLENGRVANSSGSAGAPGWFTEAWDLARELGADGLAVDAGHMAAIVTEGPVSEGWHRRALGLAEVSPDPDARRWLGSLLNNMGWSAHDSGRYEEALNLFERAEAFRAGAGDPVAHRIARWAVARARRSLGRLEEALEEQLALRDDIAAAGAPHDGYVSEEVGELLLALERPDQARAHFADAHRLLSADPWLAEHEPERLARLRDLAG